MTADAQTSAPTPTTPSITIIICTVENSGREERLRTVLDHLREQLHVTVEIILVWQGWDVANAPSFPGVRVLPLTIWSSSLARNKGAELASHPFLCFLDDDTYPVGDTALHDAIALLERDRLDFLACNIRSEGAVQAADPIAADIDFSPKTIIGNMWEPGVTIRTDAFRATGFDPTLGIGCIHGSSEGLDFGLRLLAAGYRGRRVAGLLVDHPPLPANDTIKLDRSFFYALGNGAVLVQHKLYSTYAWQLTKSIGRFFVSLLKGDATRTRAAAIRSFCLVLGPIVPRGTPLIVPRRK
ncbi:glycosyltransferase [Novosphingobium sp. SG720]|uniref:glycosyltransferase family 2 protein n=1 Tax=Novosphingobium sp. SG720 TaxID=2586998 RepID=UPI001447B0D1|nr:glycosyltransferase [Novosphingobium sp. SG720]NKJ43252.1 GT2 family glycosyltransferase [Novosphingobium sp. SG720]